MPKRTTAKVHETTAAGGGWMLPEEGKGLAAGRPLVDLGPGARNFPG